MTEISKLFGNMWPIVIVVLIILACIAVAVLIAVLINANKTIKEANKTVEKLNVMADEVNEQITPALKKVDPLVEQANLTVETVNLELLRLDGILEDVQNVTGIAGKAANTVDSVTSAPVKAVAGAAERVRSFFGDSRKKKQTKKLVYPAGTSLVNEAVSEDNADINANIGVTSDNVANSNLSDETEKNIASTNVAAAASSDSESSTNAINATDESVKISSDLDQAATLEELAAMLRTQDNAANTTEVQQGKHSVAKHQKTQVASDKAQSVSDTMQGNDTTNVDLQAEEIIKKLSERQ